MGFALPTMSLLISEDREGDLKCPLPEGASMATSGCGIGPVPAPGTAPSEGGWQNQALRGLRCAMDFKFRNCSDLYFEKNPWDIKYLQKISSCVNNRKIQYYASGLVFNKFENFMILLLLFIAYFICRCLFSQAAWIWVFDHLVPTQCLNREPLALPRQHRCLLRPGPLAAPMGHVQERVSRPGFLCPSQHGPAGGTGGPRGAEGAAGARQRWRAAEGDGGVAPTLMGSSPQVIKPRLMLTVM